MPLGEHATVVKDAYPVGEIGNHPQHRSGTRCVQFESNARASSTCSIRCVMRMRFGSVDHDGNPCGCGPTCTIQPRHNGTTGSPEGSCLPKLCILSIARKVAQHNACGRRSVLQIVMF